MTLDEWQGRRRFCSLTDKCPPKRHRTNSFSRAVMFSEFPRILFESNNYLSDLQILELTQDKNSSGERNRHLPQVQTNCRNPWWILWKNRTASRSYADGQCFVTQRKIAGLVANLCEIRNIWKLTKPLTIKNGDFFPLNDYNVVQIQSLVRFARPVAISS